MIIINTATKYLNGGAFCKRSCRKHIETLTPRVEKLLNGLLLTLVCQEHLLKVPDEF